MKMLGAEVRPVTAGSSTLKDAMNEALRDWVATCETTFYCIGTVAGPHPYPAMVRDFQCVIGNEVRTQIMEAEPRLPDTLVDSIGGGPNAMVLFQPFHDYKAWRIIGVQPRRKGRRDRNAPPPLPLHTPTHRQGAYRRRTCRTQCWKQRWSRDLCQRRRSRCRNQLLDPEGAARRRR